MKTGTTIGTTINSQCAFDRAIDNKSLGIFGELCLLHRRPVINQSIGLSKHKIYFGVSERREVPKMEGRLLILV